jgi:hypothetical protein
VKFTIVTCESGDWEGVYLGDELIEQGHSVPLWMALEHLAKKGKLSYERITLADEYLESLGNLPEKLSEVV